MVILWGAKCFGCPFFAAVFLKCFAAGVGYQDWLRCFLKCFAAAAGGYQDSLRASCAAARGGD